MDGANELSTPRRLAERHWPGPLTLASARSFAAFFGALSLSAVAVALARQLTPVLMYLRTAIVLNAGAAAYVGGLARDVREGVRLAAEAIDSGRARETLARFVSASQRLGAAEAAPV